MSKFVLAVHGGAGTFPPEMMTGSLQNALQDSLRAALEAGHRVLAAGGLAQDAVVAAVMLLEDDPQFNAGRGSVFNAAGQQEMDAALMVGRTRSAGGVAGICGPRNPILAAQAVMEQSSHVLMCGAGAMEFLRDKVEFEEEEYFQTERRWRALQAKVSAHRAGKLAPLDDQDRHGTVGAVAMDATGGLAAGTSTGGVTAKMPGRIGDSPLIGAGTWASEVCAVSATGDGEHFMRAAAAHEIAARLRFTTQTLAQAGEDVIAGLGKRGGSGGLIAVDAAGNIAMPFNSRGMYRGSIDAAGNVRTAIFRQDLPQAARSERRASLAA